MHIFSTLEKLFNSKKEIQKINSTEISQPIKISNYLDKKENTYENKNFNFNNKEKQPNEKNSCYALFAKDGDTFVGMHNNEKKTFRLAGINTPEKGQSGAKEATDFLKENIGKKVVFLNFLGKDIYNREIVEVFLDKERTLNINEKLIEMGLATSERYKNKNGELTHSLMEYSKHEIKEKIAKIKGAGVWGGNISDVSNSKEIETLKPPKKRFGNK